MENIGMDNNFLVYWTLRFYLIPEIVIKYESIETMSIHNFHFWNEVFYIECEQLSKEYIILTIHICWTVSEIFKI